MNELRGCLNISNNLLKFNRNLDDKEDFDTATGTTENKLYGYVAKATDLLHNIQPQVPIEQSIKEQIRLPKISLPQCSGMIEDWFSFQETIIKCTQIHPPKILPSQGRCHLYRIT